jgi:tripartite-type tricarboxylate transporter receptor subunit TctC
LVITLLATTLAAVVLWQAAAGQESYPSRLVRMIVPFPACGTADILPRIVGEKFSEKWRQPVVIENRAGAGGNIGAEAVAGSPPDGYVLLASPPGPIAINDTLYRNSASSARNLNPPSCSARCQTCSWSSRRSQLRPARELIAHVKANPGKVTFRLARQRLDLASERDSVPDATGTDMVHVPYRGCAPALEDIMATTSICSSTISAPRSISTSPAICAFWRSAALAACRLCPIVPTLQEVGVSRFQSVTLFAMVAPPGTPGAVTQTINKTINEVLQLPGVRDNSKNGRTANGRFCVGDREVHRRRARALGGCHPHDKHQDRVTNRGLAATDPPYCAA